MGIFGTGQGYEALLLRMRAHPLREVRDYADLMLVELRKVIPAFLKRLERPERGGVWSRYLAENAEAIAAVAARVLDGIEPEPRPEVTLTDWDPDGEVKVIAAALYAASRLPDDQLLAVARKLGPRSGARSWTPTSAGARTGATSPGAPSSAPSIASTCSATTAPSATCSGTGCSPSSGSRSRPGTAT